MKYSVNILEDMRGLAVLTVDAPNRKTAKDKIIRYADDSQHNPTIIKVRVIFFDTLRKAATV